MMFYENHPSNKGEMTVFHFVQEYKLNMHAKSFNKKNCFSGKYTMLFQIYILSTMSPPVNYLKFLIADKNCVVYYVKLVDSLAW